MKNLAPILLALLSRSLLAATSDLPPLILPEGVGINIHFTRGHERDLDMIAAAGFKFIRMDFGWGGIERRKGEYDWAAYDELTGNLEKRGLRAIYIFDYSNGLYEDSISAIDPVTGKEHRDTASPHKPESVAAFARWAAASAQHFKDRRVVWEIWNEPNISFWKPKPSAKEYSALALATCKAVRSSDPLATIIAPGSSTFPWSFIEELFKAGALEYLDAVSVHPYRNYSKGPESAAEDYLRLRTLIERYGPPAKRSMPIISGEWGYATHAKGGVSLDTQAAFIARQQIANVWQGVPISIWYDWKNDGDDPNYNENNFGTVSNNLALKPSYVAVQTLTRQLAGFHIARRLEATNQEDFIFLLVNSLGPQKLAAWTIGKPHACSIDVGLTEPGDLGIVSGQGQPLALKLVNGALQLDLQPAPQYITLHKPSRSLQAAASWSFPSFVPSLVQAGATSRLALPIQVSNPFDQPAQVRIAVESPAGNDEKTIRLDSRQSVANLFALNAFKRNSEAIPCTVRVAFSEAAANGEWRPLAQSTETRRFLVSNPLTLSLSLVESGLRVGIENPSGLPFNGNAEINGQRLPVNLANGALETSIEAPLPRGANPTAAVQLFEASGQPATDTLHCRFLPLAVSGITTAVDGDVKVAGTASATEAPAPGGNTKPFARAFRLDYSFAAGWRFARCVAKSDRPLIFEGQPTALGLWVYGDNSGNLLRMRVVDSRGQYFQPGGPKLDWTGWRWVQFDLKDLSHAGHWGGPDDGAVHGPLRLDTLLLVDGSRTKTAGVIYFTGATLVF